MVLAAVIDMRYCIFCGNESYESSSCSRCGFIQNRVREFEMISPGEGPIELETHLRETGFGGQMPGLEILSRIQNKVLRGGGKLRSSVESWPGIEPIVMSKEYYGIV
jgi:hypothetical protein